MKKAILILAILALFSSFSPKLDLSDFCDGFDVGYCEGWKDVKGQLTVCSPTPPCPVPEVDANTYNGGYNKGFRKGRVDADSDD
tara:strand:+ start:5900 stop:6151 length:252 start_codon:yes stop_codon:yes gene_type:complete